METSNSIQTAEKTNLLEQKKQLDAKLKELKEVEKQLREEKKRAAAAERAAKQEQENQLFSHPKTQVVLNIRFTNPDLFEGSKYRTLENPEIVQMVLDYFLNQ